MSNLQNIRRVAISEEVYQQLRNALSNGEWVPGQRIPPENDLANTLGVSRVSVRAALQKLASVGLVESRRGEGTFVKGFSSVDFMELMLPVVKLSDTEIHYLLEYRSVNEVTNVGFAALRRDREDLIALKKNLAKHRGCENNYHAAAECDLNFHYLIAQATRNPFIIRSQAILREVFRSALYSIVERMGTAHAFRYHGELIEAIEEKDADKAKRIMAEHVSDTSSAMDKATRTKKKRTESQ